jgi:hypothetical protein
LRVGRSTRVIRDSPASTSPPQPGFQFQSARLETGLAPEVADFQVLVKNLGEVCGGLLSQRGPVLDVAHHRRLLGVRTRAAVARERARDASESCLRSGFSFRFGSLGL